MVLWMAGCTAAAPPATSDVSGSVQLATFSGPVTPVLDSYLERAIANAEASNAAALILQLDTPGGSVDITQRITQRMMAAHVPVVVYVAPRGARAGSAGTFITLAAHVAAMAPGTSIGAASPVGSEGQDLPDTLRAKATNILTADIKNLAARRGERAADWAAKAVSEAAAATADEALALGVVDIVAADVDDLLAQLDGRTVTVAGTETILHTADLPVQESALSPLEGLLNAISHPAIAAILLTLGLNLLLFEFSSPGGFLAGIVGAVCLLLALYALGTMEANWVGLGFVALGFALFALDIKAPTHGALTVGGLASFIGGLYLLFNQTGVAIPWVTIIGLGLATAAFFVFAIAKAMQARLRPPATGLESLIGRTAVVRRALEPDGMVFVEGELWRADGESGPIAAGEQVIIVGCEGSMLHVRRKE
jgi:membrane-bound serine protease (ClpP class)